MSSFYIDPSDRRPIWEQLAEQVKGLVLHGVMMPGEQLPSVRVLAGELAINPNTIQKAYAELERQGVTYSVAGRGCFVSQDPTKLIEENSADILTQVRAWLDKGFAAGMPKETFSGLLDDIWGIV